MKKALLLLLILAVALWIKGPALLQQMNLAFEAAGAGDAAALLVLAVFLVPLFFRLTAGKRKKV